MKHGEMANKGLYAGTGVGLVLFLLVGMFPGSLIGGAAGLYITNLIMGGVVDISLLPRIITALSMVAGVICSAAFFVVGSSVAGWAIGTALEVIMTSETAPELEEAKQTSNN